MIKCKDYACHNLIFQSYHSIKYNISVNHRCIPVRKFKEKSHTKLQNVQQSVFLLNCKAAKFLQISKMKCVQNAWKDSSKTSESEP